MRCKCKDKTYCFLMFILLLLSLDLNQPIVRKSKLHTSSPDASSSPMAITSGSWGRRLWPSLMKWKVKDWIKNEWHLRLQFMLRKKICLWWHDCISQLAEIYWFWNILPCNKWVHKPLRVLNKILNWLARKPPLPGNIDWPGWAGLIDS